MVKLRKARGLSVKDLQIYFGFGQPQAIYKWQWGERLPSVDNLYALSKILNTPIDDILVGNDQDFLFYKGMWSFCGKYGIK
ncbi:helix-turn-helix transcriptional regulator [Cellulosilyticum ruminicola]|uniref:helix-turn-helix transcriptional regulator n=1 Tax=Cellulosilyticum ruminicola TaxID=425254 RepID=UPI00278C7B73|nr:helix-turn-helix transcriptional regulator [Cellulosilyticum ruminicola]